MTVVITISLFVLALSALLCVVRVVAGESVADRVIALDTLLMVAVAGVAVWAVQADTGVFLDTLLAVALVAFIGTTAVARFVERKGTR